MIVFGETLMRYNKIYELANCKKVNLLVRSRKVQRIIPRPKKIVGA